MEYEFQVVQKREKVIRSVLVSDFQWPGRCLVNVRLHFHCPNEEDFLSDKEDLTVTSLNKIEVHDKYIDKGNVIGESVVVVGALLEEEKEVFVSPRRRRNGLKKERDEICCWEGRRSHDISGGIRSVVVGKEKPRGADATEANDGRCEVVLSE